ncbi:hypothetical protein [Kitasatospora sp. A2-31]|uniref:hypothetical protein n=1 Tax=Kitasatospora sp. A2-31 TaxID=2916414 RepID=UPI001EEB3F62|nr:hypothetical protein [Kitasatospora sp. A2-31]MCG6494531.1 hypothetical protein [Kitasatospora sp. A2-31]
MTDKNPRLPGGGADPGESPMEQLLREAMNARAAQITAHDLRPADPPSRRMRRLRPVYLAAVPAFALAAALAVGVLNFRADDVAEHRTPDPAATVTTSPASPSPTATASPSPTATASGSPSPSATADDEPDVPAGRPGGSPAASSSTTAPATSGTATQVTFRGVKFKAPAGWRVLPPRSEASTEVCVLSPGAPASASYNDCEPYGVTVYSYDTAEVAKNANWPVMSTLESDSGWEYQPYCPVWGNPHVPTASEKITSTAVRTRDIVAGRPVYKTQWQVSCNATESFTAQLWGLDKDEVFVAAIGLKPEYQAGLVSMLDSIDLSGRQAPSARAHENDISVSVEGLGTGQQVPNNGTPVTFSVTYRNTSQTDYAKVQPFVITEQYAGTPASDAPVAFNSGKLERQDGDTWTQVAVSPGSDMGYAVADPKSLFPLAPGQSRTVRFRLTMDRGAGPGVMPVTVQALLPYTGSGELTPIGERSIPVRVVAK